MVGEVLREKKLISLAQAEDRVTVELSGGEMITADWVLGCDGYHSTVRELVGADYIGSDLKEHFIMIDAPIEMPYSLEQGHTFFSKAGALMILPMKGHARVMAEISQDPSWSHLKNFTVEDFQKIASERMHMPIRFGTPLWQSSFWIHERIRTQYRQGRVFLAGDAAHAHSPAGGQGMNTGFQDVHNLVWKLAAVIKQRVSSILLDTYAEERRPIAKQILLSSTYMTHFASVRGVMTRMLRRVLLSILSHSPKIKFKMALTLAQLNIRYKNQQNNGGRYVPFISTGYQWVLVISSACLEREKLSEYAREHDISVQEIS